MIFGNDIKKSILILLGTLTLGIGIIGIFLPLLPTTPLLLITAYCYLNSSNKLYTKLINSKRLGPYIKDYIENKAVTKKVKKTAIAVLWMSLVISIVLIENTYIQVFLGLTGIGVSIYILSLKTIEHTDNVCA